jgi:hypothetical protein
MHFFSNVQMPVSQDSFLNFFSFDRTSVEEILIDDFDPGVYLLIHC